MSCGITAVAWAGVECPVEGDEDQEPAREGGAFFGVPEDDSLVCATDPFDDFDDDDFDDEFDDDFEEEWDEELPGDADQFEPDPVEAEEADNGLPVEPDFEDED